MAAAEGKVRVAGLAEQDLSSLDVSKLTPLTPEVISRQATINIGTIGHVAHGKSTIVKALSGKSTVKFKAEFSRNITIKLGYANAKIYRSTEPDAETGEYIFETHGSDCQDEYVSPTSGARMTLVRHISFVDCPGHDILMATMLNGAAVMDAAMLLIAANEPCPQPQTSEHLAAVEIMQLANILILQNKVDLIQQEDAAEQYNVIKNFVAGTVAGKAPILPISAQLGYNVDMVARFIYSRVPVPIRNFDATPRLIVIRSFDVNKPGQEVEKLRGGVAGGSITQGVLRAGDPIEIRPGIVTKAGKCTPIKSTIVSLFAESNELQYAVPGGLIGVGTNIDPTLTRADRLVGQVLGLEGQLPDVFKEVDVKYHLLRRLLGQRAESGSKQARVSKLSKGESLMVNIGSTSTGATVISTKSDTVRLALVQPVCTELHEKIALSRRVDKHWRLIGWGTIRSGKTVELEHMA